MTVKPSETISSDPTSDTALKPLQREIIAALARSGDRLTPKELSSIVTSAYGSVRNAVGPMTEAGLLKRVVHGRYAAYGLGPVATEDVVREALESQPEVGKSLPAKVPSGSGMQDRSGQKGGQKPPAPFAHSLVIREPVPDPVTSHTSRTPPDPSAAPSDGKLVEIPLLVDIAAEAAGPNGGFLVDSDYFEVEPSGVHLPDTYIRQMYGVSPDRVYYIHGRGRSMIPTIMPGQRMMIALLTPGSAIRDGLIYVIDYAAAPLGGVLVKRLELEPDHVKVVSDNHEVEDYRVPFEVWQRDYALRAIVLETAIRH